MGVAHGWYVIAPLVLKPSIVVVYIQQMKCGTTRSKEKGDILLLFHASYYN
jgi:hypothetical protein